VRDLSIKFIVGNVYETKTNYKKLIRDLQEQYPYDPLSTLIIETFANSLDANATHIDIYIDEECYMIKDDGKGMSESEFYEYHNIASLTKDKGKGGIGFAGIGAKIYLDYAEYIITETKSKNFHGASKWRFVEEIPKWEIISPKENIIDTGTVIKVKLSPQHKGKLTKQFIIKILQEHYNAVLLGFYHVKEVRVNNEKVKPWGPQEIDKRYDFSFKIKGHEIKGYFIKARNQIPEEFQGISVIVYGKTIIKQEWFKQFPLANDTITGLVMADYLIKIVTTSKTQFVRTTMIWKNFHAKISMEFSKWLEKIGAKQTFPEISPDVNDMIKQLEKSINNILISNPEFSDLANSIFQNIVKRQTVIKSARGEFTGKENEGSQIVSGTLIGSTEGGGVKTIGPDEGIGVVEAKNGDIKVEKIKRKMRSGIKIGFFEKSDDQNEGWIDPASQTITINTGHPAYKIACALSIDGGISHVWIYHLLRVITKVLSKEVEESPETIENKILIEWYNKSVEDVTKNQIKKFFPIRYVMS
jgi:hypothetical protein